MAYGIQNVGRGKPVKTGPGGFVPMSAGMSLPQLYGALAAQERYGALIDSAYKDWLRSAPATSVSLMRGGSTPQQAQGASQTRLTGPAPSYGTDGAGEALAENRQQQDSQNAMFDQLAVLLAQASKSSMMERMGQPLLTGLGMFAGGALAPAGQMFAGAGVGGQGGNLLAQLLGSRY